jgi:hypothetical protein
MCVFSREIMDTVKSEYKARFGSLTLFEYGRFTLEDVIGSLDGYTIFWRG